MTEFSTSPISAPNATAALSGYDKHCSRVLNRADLEVFFVNTLIAALSTPPPPAFYLSQINILNMDYGLSPLPPSFARRIHSPQIKQQQNPTPPPTYPLPAYQLAGPYGGPNPQPQPYHQLGGFPPQGYPQQGHPPQQGMYYQQQPNGPPQGYFANRNGYDRGGTRGAEAGLCAALAASLACCCCLDCGLF